MHPAYRAGPPPIVVAIAVAALIASPRLASADWPQFGRAISTAANAQVHPAIATDGAGGAIISWQDHRDARVNLFAQHVLATGDLDTVWPAQGRALLTDPNGLTQEVIGIASPVMVSDHAGGAIVAWEDNRSDVTATDIFAQHVLASGAVDGAWPANGTPLAEIQGLQNEPVICPDGAGGAMVAWMDTRPGASVSDIYAQHVLPSGIVDARWPVNGLAVSTAAGAQKFPTIVDDGAGGAIITWFDLRDSTTSGFDIYAQHVLNSGVADPGWPVNGRAVCTAAGDQGNPTITSDAAHGAIITWGDSRIVGTSHIFAQHVLASGAIDPAWPLNGRAVSAAGLIETRSLVVPDGAGGAIVTWQAFTVHLNMFAQHIKSTGVLDQAWPAGGRQLSVGTREESHADIVADGSGGAIIAWEDSIDVVAQHVLASGALDPAYPNTGRAMSELPNGQGDVGLVATGGDGAIATWTDTRNLGATSPDIFALQVLNAGTADVPQPARAAGVALATPRPNPARGSLVLRFALPREALVRLTIYDLYGRRVRELVAGPRAAGESSIGWDLRDDGGSAVPAGLYFARLAADGHSLTQKLVTLR